MDERIVKRINLSIFNCSHCRLILSHKFFCRNLQHLPITKADTKLICPCPDVQSTKTSLFAAPCLTMAKVVDWSLNESALRKKLLQLSQPKLRKACKYKKVKYNGTKQDMIARLLTANKSSLTNNKKKKSKKDENMQRISKMSNLYKCSLIIEYWHRQNIIDTDINNQDIINIIIDFCREIYRRVPVSYELYKNWRTGSKLKRLNLYCTKQQFDEEFVNNEDLNKIEQHKSVVQALINTESPIDFDKEVLLIMNIAISPCYKAQLYQKAEIKDDALVITYSQSQWRLGGRERTNINLWCFVINKMCNEYTKIVVKKIHSWADDDPDSYGTNIITNYIHIKTRTVEQTFEVVPRSDDSEEDYNEDQEDDF